MAYRSMGIWESDEAGERIHYSSDVPRAAAMAIRAAVAKVTAVITWQPHANGMTQRTAD